MAFATPIVTQHWVNILNEAISKKVDKEVGKIKEKIGQMQTEDKVSDEKIDVLQVKVDNLDQDKRSNTLILL